MLVCHISPTYFAPESVIGGGERFVEELAQAMAARCNVKLISFGKTPNRNRVNAKYERVILRNWTRDSMTPFSPWLFRELQGADVIHCHQYYVLSTFLSALWGYLRRVPVFVTDLGGGGWTPAYHIDQSRWIAAHLPISRYAAQRLPPGRNQNHYVIYAGVDPSRWSMRPSLRHDGSVVFLGRILPHKGIHFLIQGIPSSMPLKVIGPIMNAAYYEELKRLAQGKSVQFLHNLSDAEVREYLVRAMALVHPTPVDETGSPRAYELFGLAVVEAMACGCVPVVSNVGPLPEIVENGISGILVPPNDPQAIREALERLHRDHLLWARLSQAARERIEQHFTWDQVVDRCLKAYQMFRSFRD